MSGSAVASSGRVVALTGACTYLGTELLRRLEEDRRYARVIALDVAPPPVRLGGGSKLEYVKLDLTQPTVDDDLATLLDSAKVDTVVHGAFLSHPTHALEWAHEFEDVGTMHLLNACAGTSPRRVVMVSTTLVYGAHPHNPNYLTEDAELRGQRGFAPGRTGSADRFVADRVRAERQAQRFAIENPRTQVCVLRFAPILGPTVQNLFTRFLSRPLAPVMMGHNPLLQLVHEQDAAWAFKRAVDGEATGAFNIVGKGVLPYTTVLAMLGRVQVPLPSMLARPLARALWALQLADAPPGLLDYVTYLCVADGARAKAELGFAPRLSIKRTLLDFLGVSPEDGATDVARAHG